MESNAFTRTSFCGKECDNITDNDTKKFILQDMKFKCNVDYSTNYARLFNVRFAKNLNNPHVVCIKTTGAPYFMYCTRINDIGYTFLIDKKIKEGYDFPKIFVLPYRFNKDIYSGTLLETELVRDKKHSWFLLIGDLYQYCGKSQQRMDIIKRVNIIYQLLNDNYTDDSYLDLCPLQVKGFFEYKDLQHLKENIMPKLPYQVRGFYYVPINTKHAKVLQLLDRKQQSPSQQQQQQSQQQPSQHHKKPDNEIQKQSISKVNVEKNVSFQFLKTLKPDIYDLYVQDNDDKIKVGIPSIPNMRVSKLVRKAITNREMECFIECTFKDSKWVPEKVSDHIDTFTKYNWAIKTD